MSDRKMMADLALNGNAPEMRATAREGGGFNILCAGGSPHMWFGPMDEVSVFEWLGKRGTNVRLPSLRWSDLAVDDDVAGIDLCTTDGVSLRINDVSAWELHEWLGVKLGRPSMPRPVVKEEPAHDGQQPEEEREADRMKILEDAHGGKVMRLRDLPAQYDELRSWISARYGVAHILAVLDGEYARLKWYTRDSIIGVVIHLPTEKRPQGYIGATASGRCPNPGETWTRGNDLADGPYCRDTWDRVVADAAFWDALPLEFDLRSRIERATDNATYAMLRQMLSRQVAISFSEWRPGYAQDATGCDVCLVGAKTDDNQLIYPSTATIMDAHYDVQLVACPTFVKSLAECRESAAGLLDVVGGAVHDYLICVDAMVKGKPGCMFTPANLRMVRIPDTGSRCEVYVYGFVLVPMVEKGVDVAAPGADHSAAWVEGAPQPEKDVQA